MTCSIAYCAASSGASLELITRSLPSPAAQEVLVAITHCGVCRSDWHFLQNSWGDGKFPLIPGHEIIGHVVNCGSQVTEFKVGQRVGVSWQVDACLRCEWCLCQHEEFCTDIKGIGIGAMGGFAQHIMVKQPFVYSIPENIDSAEAAPLLCAGATAFNGLLSFNGTTNLIDQRVAILGIGGLGHLAVQFAHHMGAKVTALVNDLTRADEIKALGAEQVIVSHDKTHLAQLANEFDFVLSMIDENIDYQPFINLLRPLGKFCFVGIPTQPVQINIFPLIIGQRSIVAVPVGGRKMIQDMLQFVSEHQIRSKIELMPMHQANDALMKLANGQPHFRIVLTNP